MGNDRLITIETQTKLMTEGCCKCGVLFAVPKDFQERRVRDGEWFYCPSGHAQHYTETNEEKLRRQLSSAQADVALYRSRCDNLLGELDAREREMRRVKRRVHAGTCPYCRRHFVNVERHMTTKHPEEAGGSVENTTKP